MVFHPDSLKSNFKLVEGGPHRILSNNRYTMPDVLMSEKFILDMSTPVSPPVSAARARGNDVVRIKKSWEAVILEQTLQLAFGDILLRNESPGSGSRLHGRRLE